MIGQSLVVFCSRLRLLQVMAERNLNELDSIIEIAEPGMCDSYLPPLHSPALPGTPG